MIRLTVMYNLPPEMPEEEFLKWRLGEHQQYNAGMPGVIRTDFAIIDGSWTPEQDRAKPPYRFMTVAEWADRESFEASFYSPESLADLQKDSQRIPGAVFLISEILTSTTP